MNVNVPSCSKNISHNDSSVDKLSNVINLNKQALDECQQRIDIWKTHQTDYETLQNQLKSLLEETSRDVMVPFGICAFMPGKIIHTNEISVLLGDNWFVERSSLQSSEIASRRLKYCNDMLEKFEDEKKLYQSKLDVLNEFGNESDIEEQVEIREPISDESTNKHSPKRVQFLAENESTSLILSDQGDSEPQKVSDQDFHSLMAHLDQLMSKEEEEDETIRGNNDESSAKSSQSNVETLSDIVNMTNNKKVKWHSEMQEKFYRIDEEIYESDNKVEENIETDEKPTTTRADLAVNFLIKRHQKDTVVNEESDSRRSSDPGPDSSASKSLSHKYDGNNCCLKSILKNRRESSPIDLKLVKQMDDEMTSSNRSTQILPEPVEAFSGSICERWDLTQLDQNMSQQLFRASNLESPKPTNKRMSKFRVNRANMQ